MIDEDDIKYKWDHWCEWMQENYNNERLSNNKEGYKVMNKLRLDQIIKISADSIATLRKCDVFRVLDAALDIGCHGTMIIYICESRVDLRQEVKEWLAEQMAA